MDMELKTGQKVVAAGGEKLGTVKEVVEGTDLTYFRVGVTLRPDYWLGSNWVRSIERQDGEEHVMLDFQRDLLSSYKLPAPA